MVGKKGKRAEQLHRLDRVGCSPSHQLGICRGLYVINSWKRAGTGSKTAPKSSGFPQEVQTGDPTSHFSIFSGRAVYLPSFISFHGLFHLPMLHAPPPPPAPRSLSEAEMQRTPGWVGNLCLLPTVEGKGEGEGSGWDIFLCADWISVGFGRGQAWAGICPSCHGPETFGGVLFLNLGCASDFLPCPCPC